MLNYKSINFSCIIFFITLFNSCSSSGQINGVKVVEENQEKKYTLIKSNVFKDEATILKDTTNKYNRYPSGEASKQYIPSITEIEMFEEVLKSNLLSDKQIASQGETFMHHYSKFKRQYSGYIDKSGDTVLVVCFLEFREKKKANEIFFNWKYQNAFYGSVLYLHKKTPSVDSYSFNKRTKQLNRYKSRG